MSQDKISQVGAAGLLKHEMRFVKIMLGLTTHSPSKRTQGQYELTENLQTADIVIAGADDAEAMALCKKLAEKVPAPTLLLVVPEGQPSPSKYTISRPFGPAKVLMLLDKIVQDRQEGMAENDTFAGKVDIVHRELLLTAKAAAAARHKALVIDDSPTVRKQLILELGSFNIQVDTAESGEEGLEKLKQGSYDIVFLDVVMPGADGYQVCKTIRRMPETKTIPVVMLTSKSSPFDKVRGSLAGCNSYLTKPVEYENFYHVLEEYLTQSSNQQSMSSADHGVA